MSAEKPKPFELVQITVSLGCGPKLLGGDDSADTALGNALRVWRLAHQTIQRGGAVEELEEMAMRNEVALIASEEGKRYRWEDVVICRDVFGKADPAAAEPGKLAAVIADAIRHQLSGAFGQLGTAVFYWVKEHGITMSAADTLKHWIAGAKQGEHEVEAYSRYNFSHLLADEPAADPALTPSAIDIKLLCYVTRRRAGNTVGK